MWHKISFYSASKKLCGGVFFHEYGIETLWWCDFSRIWNRNFVVVCFFTNMEQKLCFVVVCFFTNMESKLRLPTAFFPCFPMVTIMYTETGSSLCRVTWHHYRVFRRFFFPTATYSRFGIDYLLISKKFLPWQFFSFGKFLRPTFFKMIFLFFKNIWTKVDLWHCAAAGFTSKHVHNIEVVLSMLRVATKTTFLQQNISKIRILCFWSSFVWVSTVFTHSKLKKAT